MFWKMGRKLYFGRKSAFHWSWHRYQWQLKSFLFYKFCMYFPKVFCSAYYETFRQYLTKLNIKISFLVFSLGFFHNEGLECEYSGFLLLRRSFTAMSCRYVPTNSLMVKSGVENGNAIRRWKEWKWGCSGLYTGWASLRRFLERHAGV